MDCSLLIQNLSPTLENFTAHISRIDSKSSKHKREIELRADTLKNLKSL
jgi:hypothetical protein